MKTLLEVYTNPKSKAFLAASPVKLQRIALAEYGLAFALKDIKVFLSKQPAFTLHAPARRKFKRRRTVSYGFRDLMQVDLAEFNLPRSNGGNKYILVCYLMFSKMLLLANLKTKKGFEVAAAFKSLLDQYLAPYYILRCQSDKVEQFFMPLG